MTELPLETDFRNGATASSIAAGKPADGPAQKSDIRKLQANLMTGEDSVARRKDLGELHKRTVSLFTTLNQGLVDSTSSKAADDRAQIDSRLDAMERSLNSMEGALRIEVPLLLRTAVTEALKAHHQRKSESRPVWVSIAFFLLGLCTGSIGIGTIEWIQIYHPIRAFFGY